MLNLLRIRDLTLIRELEIEFSHGLNLLTGETGSGKSIIVGALGLVLGERSGAEQIRSGCDCAVVEGVLSAHGDERIVRMLEAGGIPADDSLIIRREISVSGRGKAYVNNVLVTLTLLRSLGSALADIHGQQDQHALLDLSAHLEWLDRYGRNDAALAEVRRLHAVMRETARRLDSLETNELERRRRIGILEFQAEEIRRAGLKPGEKQELDRDRTILANREKIFSLVTEVYGQLYESDSSTLSQLKRLRRVLAELASFDGAWSAHENWVAEALYRFEDLALALRDYSSRADFSPDLLERVEHRLAEIEKLTHKYGRSVEDVLTFAERCDAELCELRSYDETSQALAAQLQGELKRYLEAAGSLSEKRRDDAARLMTELAREFPLLALGKMRLECTFRAREPLPAPGVIPAWCGPAGIDGVEFMVAPNVGEEMRPLARIASGGELSRVMLAVQSLCGSAQKDKTLVFDEVDAGIGGRAAEAVGRRLRDLSRSAQVLCVTHLPQIAAFADRHYAVSKQVVGSRTETFVRLLEGQDRVEEMARMMGGRTITAITRHHALEMLEQAARARKTAGARAGRP